MEYAVRRSDENRRFALVTILDEASANLIGSEYV
jgi:hypothetical protein